MEEQIISFETAKLAKEKGFDWETEEFYTNPKKPYLAKGVQYGSDSDTYVRLWKWNSMPSNYPTNEEDVLCAAPTQSLLQKWLREEHNIYIELSVQEAKVIATWYWKIFKHRGSGKGLIWIYEDSNGKLSDTYEDALEEALKVGLKIE